MPAVFAGNWKQAKQQAASVERLEETADDLKKKIRLGLPRSLLLQVSRDDLLELTHKQDEIANVTKDLVGLIVSRQIEFPQEVHEPLLRGVTSSIKTVSLLKDASEEISHLVITGFGRHESRLMEEKLIAVGDSERQSDLDLADTRATLFTIEDRLNPLNAMFMYRCIEFVGRLADAAESSGNRMLQLIAR